MKTFFTAALVLASAVSADAQGIYMLNGRATPSVIVGSGGEVYPVVPGPHYDGPSPVLLAPPVGALPPPPPQLPPPVVFAPPPPPLGWVFGNYLSCMAPPPDAPPSPPACVVTVDAAGLNVRLQPNGQPIMALANGTPVTLTGKAGRWFSIAPACYLHPTFLWSWTAGVPLMAC
jgi:hypothetical protein